MWIEIVDENGNTVGAVNSECCDLIKIDGDPKGGALIRSSVAVNASGSGEVYKTRISYLRLIETITQAEAEGLKQIAEIVADAKIDQTDPAKPRIVLV